MPDPAHRLDGVDVLVIDDNDDARDVLESILRYSGAHVRVAKSAAEALGLLEIARAHVILTDISMPGMTGYEFLERLRARPEEQERPTPVIGITGFPNEGPQMAAAGFQASMQKPVEPFAVVDEIVRIIAGPTS